MGLKTGVQEQVLSLAKFLLLIYLCLISVRKIAILLLVDWDPGDRLFVKDPYCVFPHCWDFGPKWKTRKELPQGKRARGENEKPPYLRLWQSLKRTAVAGISSASCFCGDGGTKMCTMWNSVYFCPYLLWVCTNRPHVSWHMSRDVADQPVCFQQSKSYVCLRDGLLRKNCCSFGLCPNYLDISENKKVNVNPQTRYMFSPYKYWRAFEQPEQCFLIWQIDICDI